MANDKDTPEIQELKSKLKNEIRKQLKNEIKKEVLLEIYQELKTEELHDEVKSLLEKKTNHIVLNMKNVSWIGSLCIGALMREIISARQKEGDVYLASPSQKVLRLLQITRLEAVINIFPTVEDAVAAFNNN